MDPDTHACLLSNRRNLTDEVSVVVPEFLLRILAPVGERSLVGLTVPITFSSGEMEGARLTAAACRFWFARPNAIRHVCVGDVRYAGFPGVSNVLLEPLDFLVSSRQIERDLF